MNDTLDFSSQESLLNEQRKRYAQQAAQGIQQGQYVGNRFVRPSNLQLIASAIRNAGGLVGETQVNKQLEDLQWRKQQATTQDMTKFVELLRGAPGRDAVHGSDSSVMPEYQEAKAATPGSPIDAYAMALRSQSPMVQQLGVKGLEGMPALEQRKEEKLAALEARRQNLQDQIEARKEQMLAQQEFQKWMREDARAATAANRQAQIIQTEQGPMQLISGKAVPILGVGGEQVKGTTGSAGGKGAVAASKDALDAMDILSQAAPLVRKSTGSTIGAGVDSLAGLVGASTQGAQTAGQLKALGGMLIAKMPKMSGPQSDKDVQLYRDMAGNIGDPTIPAPQKEAAMQTIMEIQARYAGVTPRPLDFSGAEKQKATGGAQGGWSITPVN